MRVFVIVLLMLQALPCLAARKALLIGNGRYLRGHLENPTRDVQAVGALLAGLGFENTVHQDLGLKEMARAVSDFARGLGSDDVALLYYAGHGVEISGANYLLGVDFDAEDAQDARYEAYPLQQMLAQFDSSRARLKIIALDACRDNPFTRSWTRSAGGAGFAAIERSPLNTYIAFAASPGQMASDGPGLQHSPFAMAVLHYLPHPDLELDHIFRRVRATVAKATHNKQVPWSLSSLTESFFFSGEHAPDVKVPPPKMLAGGPTRGVSAEVETASQRRVWGWSAVGVGGAGAVLGAVLSVLAFDSNDEAKTLRGEAAAGDRTRAEVADQDATTESLTTGSFISYGLGAALLVTGVTLLLTGEDSAPQATEGGLVWRF